MNDAVRDRRSAFASAAMLLVAFAWFWPCLSHGLQSDDYLTVYYTDRSSGRVLWDRVFGEFTRAWFGAGDLYRPLVSLSFGIDFACWPEPAGRHAFNLACAGITAAATAATAALLAPRRAWLAALLAGLVVVLHPAAVEPAEWICSRTTGMQMAFVSIAGWLWLRHRARGARVWPSLVAFAAALGCKEGAVMAPLSLLVLDALHAPHDRLAARVRRLVPFAVVVAAYFAWRLLILGHLGGGEPSTPLQSLQNVLGRTGHLFAPPTPLHQVPLVPPIALALAVLTAVAARPRAALLALPWLALLLLPSHHLAATATTLYGRLVFDAVPALALLVGLAATSSPHSLRACLALIAPIAAIVALAFGSRAWLEWTDQNDQRARATERALATVAAKATAAQPLACTGLPYLPLFHQKLWGVLGLAPFAPHDLAVIGLPEMLVPDEHFPEFRHDAAPVHAVLAAGGTVATLRHDTLQFAALPAPPAKALPLVPGEAPGDFRADAPWPGSAIAALEVQLPTPATTLRWRFLDDVPTEHAFGTATHAARSPVTWIDTTHALAPVLLQSAGVPFRGVHLEVDGQPPPAGTKIVVHGAIATRALAARTAGQLRPRDELFALPGAPPFREPARLYLMLPTGVRHQDVPASGAPMGVALREHLRWALDLYAPLTVHWFWQSLPDADGPPWRSELDWATAR